MDRFSIALGKSYVSAFIKIPSETPEHVAALPEIKNKLVIEDVWYSPKQKISLERSPKEARCPVCGKSIDSKKFRFSVVTFNARSFKNRFISITHKYHIKCLPREEQIYIKSNKSAKTKKKERANEGRRHHDSGLS